MSKSQLQTNNAKLSELITTLQGKAAGGGGGGSSSGVFTYEDKPCFTYTVDSVGGASYGFSQNSAGYWESENKGVKSTYAICRVHFEVAAACDITFDVINYAENRYDYGLMGNLDSALKLSIDPDGTVKQNFNTTHSASVVNVTYADVPTGSHFIDIKYRKDSSTNSNNDSFQFKVQAAPTYQALSAESMAMIRAEDADLVAGNIKSGVDIFGVTGTYTGGGATLETCTLQISDSSQLYAIAYTTVDSSGNVTHAYVIPSSTSQTITCLCNSTVAISHYVSVASNITCDGCEMLYCAGAKDTFGHTFIGLTCGAGETATFVANATSSSGGAIV